MKSSVIAGFVLVSTSLALGCAGKQSNPADASTVQDADAQDKEPERRRGFDRLERLQN